MALPAFAPRLLAVIMLLAACAPTPTMSVSAESPASSSSAPAIVQIGAPVLRKRADEVAPERIASAEIQQLIRAMIEAMRAAPGVGLAAPQLGVSLRVLVLEDRTELMAKLGPAELRERERVAVPLRVFVNPVLRPVGDETRTFFEGCLSVQGYTALVERSAEVEVTGLDERGQPHTMHVRGWPARILQHEVDHLDGTLYVDRMLSRSFSTTEQARALHGGRPIEEIRRTLGL
jgi:peptide deformylase